MGISKILPDFLKPPLEEVVLGVQFAPCSSYSSVHAGQVWELFRTEFTEVQEHHALEPQFEVFGGVNPQSGVQIKFGPPPAKSRLWFISQDQNHLIQFQYDRLLLNWRKQPNGQEYPRFESIAKGFNENLAKLDGFFQKTFEQQLVINQAEVSYVNIVPVKDFSEAGDWFNFWGDNQLKIEGLSINFTEVVKNKQDQAFARLSYELQSMVTPDGKGKAFRLALTFRGKPDGDKTADGTNFIETGRAEIVTRFCEITTKKAQKKWRRQV